MPLHIGLVSPEYPITQSAYGTNGISTYCDLMAKELAGQGHRVTVFSASGASGSDVRERERIRSLHFEPCDLRSRVLRGVYYRYLYAGSYVFPSLFVDREYGLWLREAVRRVHRQHALDVLECPEVRGIGRWVRGLGPAVVLRLHTSVLISARANRQPRPAAMRGFGIAERAALDGARFVTAPSEAIVEETKRTLNVALNGVCVIPNPVKTDEARTSGVKKTNGRELLFVGRVELLKGFDGAVEAFAHLAGKSAFADVRLRIAGPDRGVLVNGSRLSGAEFAQARLGGQAGRVEFMGSLRHDRIEALRSSAPVTIIPSRFENFPYTVIEAMAAACPVIASDAGGIPEIIQHERNGLLFRSEDWRDLADQMERLLVDASLRERLAAQARKDVVARYAPRVICERMTEFYESVIDRHAAERQAPARAAALGPGRRAGR